MVDGPFFFNDTATTEIYTLSLHDALPICVRPLRPPARLVAGAPPRRLRQGRHRQVDRRRRARAGPSDLGPQRSEEHTSELQLRQYLVCRLLLEKNTTKPVRTRYLST